MSSHLRSDSFRLKLPFKLLATKLLALMPILLSESALAQRNSLAAILAPGATLSNIYCTGPIWIAVLDPTGKLLGKIAVPEQPTDAA